jgi:hypothetical protein
LVLVAPAGLGAGLLVRLVGLVGLGGLGGLGVGLGFGVAAAGVAPATSAMLRTAAAVRTVTVRRCPTGVPRIGRSFRSGGSDNVVSLGERYYLPKPVSMEEIRRARFELGLGCVEERQRRSSLVGWPGNTPVCRFPSGCVPAPQINRTEMADDRARSERRL